METTGLTALKAPETALLERMKQRGGEITDRFVINFVEHQISRIEVSISSSKCLSNINTDFIHRLALRLWHSDI